MSVNNKLVIYVSMYTSEAKDDYHVIKVEMRDETLLLFTVN